MKKLVSHKIRLRPTSEQKAAFSRHAGVARWAYNRSLARYNEDYQSFKKGEIDKKSNLNGIKKEITQLKKSEDFSWLKDSPQAAAAEAVNNLKKGFDRFFENVKKNRRVGSKKNPYEYPQFKSKHSSKQSFKPVEGRHSDYKIQGNRIFIRKVGWVKLAEKPRFSGRCYSQVVSKCSDGNWYISLSFEVESYPVKPRLADLGPVGIDLGCKTAAVLSDGSKFNPERYYNVRQRRKRRLQRQKARRVKGSNRRSKTKAAIAKIDFTRASRRSAKIHEFTNTLVRSFNRIAIEDLCLKGMAKLFGKSIHDRALGEIRRQLEYKSVWYQTDLVVVDRFYPSSKLCSGCGVKKIDLQLSDRIYRCNQCGLKIDRDLNAAINLKNQIT